MVAIALGKLDVGERRFSMCVLEHLENRPLALVSEALATIGRAAHANVKHGNDYGEEPERENWQKENARLRRHSGLCI